MAITYNVIERKDPRDPSLPIKYYAKSRSNGELTLRQLAKRISDISTVSSIDTHAVLEALLQVIPEELANGFIVRLGDFGSFYTTLKTHGADEITDFNETYIDKTSVRFRPGREVKNVLNNVQYKKITLN